MATTLTDQDREFRDLRYILKDLLKVIKVVSAYPEDNQLPQSLKRSFAEQLVKLVDIHGQLRLTVRKSQLVHRDEIVFEDRSREESLAALFFDTGITNIAFGAELTSQGVIRLLAVIKDYVNCPDRARDLAAELWEADIPGFTFETVVDVNLTAYDQATQTSDQRVSRRERSLTQPDRSGRWDAIFEDTVEIDEVDVDTSDPVGPGLGPEMTAPGFALSPAGSEADDSGLRSMAPIERTQESLAEGIAADGDLEGGMLESSATVSAMRILRNKGLSEADEEQARELVIQDAMFDEYESTIELLKEMLHQEVQMDRFYESVTICERILTAFLKRSRLAEAGQILSYLSQLQKQIADAKPLWAERLQEARIACGSRDRLRAFAEALNSRMELGPDELRGYLDLFDWQALSGITDLLGDLEHRAHREILCDYLAFRGRDKIEIVAKAVYDKRWFVVRNGVMILGRIGDERVVSHLSKVVRHEDLRVRRETIAALASLPGQRALDLLRSMIKDHDQEIRAKVLDAIVARGGEDAFEAIGAIIDDESFPKMDRHEQQRLLNAYSLLGDEQAIDFLSQLIMKVNVYRDSTLTFLRQAAFEALTVNGSNRSEELLKRLARSWRPDVRQRAAAALYRRRQMETGEVA